MAAARELANVADRKGLREDYIVPSMAEWEVFPSEAAAVAMKAVEQGIARTVKTREEYFKMAEERIKHARGLVQHLMKDGFIAQPPANLL